MNEGNRPPRAVMELTRNWLYHSTAIPGADELDFDDSWFEKITLPHTNKILPWHSFDDREYQFVSVYRRHIRLPEELAGRRIFIDFDGVLTSATVTFNGRLIGEHRGGYTPFSFEVTPHVRWGSDNVLAVVVDSTEQVDVPPFGGYLDYLTFGGIYREVYLRAVPNTFIENVFAKPVDALDDGRRVDVRCLLRSTEDTNARSRWLETRLCDGDQVLASADATVPPDTSTIEVSLRKLGPVQLWDVNHPKRYEVVTRLYEDDDLLDEYVTHTGIREAKFTPDGFYLNGRRLQLRGLNRHQNFPYVGGAMPARVQQRDAWILKNELKCNIVRTSHYPQSPNFLDACDEYGLLVLEEIPGWQHIGNDAWKELSYRDVEDMIRRDWNHPSIVLWGVRINESVDDHEFYRKTNEIAHRLDDSRQTGGVRNFFDSELLEDVFTINDFDSESIRAPHHPCYLVTEFVGHTFPTKRFDNVERVQEHVLRHAQVHEMLGEHGTIAGGIGWCAFDYNTHAEFGSGDRICYHGVSDIFRVAKPAASFYRSQCDPAQEIILEPVFHWAFGDRSGGHGPGRGMILSNCDFLRLYVEDELVDEVAPALNNFSHLPHPPFFSDEIAGHWGHSWRDLRIDGYISGERVISRTMSAAGVDRQFHLDIDDTELIGDGADATRVVLRVSDEFGNPRPLATAAVDLQLIGPGEIVGENPLALVGGVGAVWVKAAAEAGVIQLKACHPVLGEQRAEITVTDAGQPPC